MSKQHWVVTFVWQDSQSAMQNINGLIFLLVEVVQGLLLSASEVWNLPEVVF